MKIPFLVPPEIVSIESSVRPEDARPLAPSAIFARQSSAVARRKALLMKSNSW
ncbi:MAG: hypothetical protein QGG38_06350 [Nitrospinaceae bacterium]|nr:hypothetical protein [Nitrospinaceae bacterium]